MKTAVLLREGGGLGDVLQTGSLLRLLKQDGYRIRYFAMNDPSILALLEHMPDADEVVPLSLRTSCRRPRGDNRFKNYGYLSPLVEALPMADKFVDLWCPGNQHELRCVRLGTMPSFSRGQCFAVAGGYSFVDLPMPNLSVEPQPPDAKQKAEEIVSALDGYPRYVIHLKAREPSRSLPNGKAMEVVESIGRLGPTLVLAYPQDQWFKALPRRSNVIWLSAEQTAENARTMLHLTILFIQQAEYVVAVDSFALHVAGTYGKKTVMLEGPTKGSVVAAMYPNTRYIHGSMDTICKPYCYFDTSKGWSLVCRTHGCLWLRSIDVDDILEEIRG